MVAKKKKPSAKTPRKPAASKAAPKKVTKKVSKPVKKAPPAKKKPAAAKPSFAKKKPPVAKKAPAVKKAPVAKKASKKKGSAAGKPVKAPAKPKFRFKLPPKAKPAPKSKPKAKPSKGGVVGTKEMIAFGQPVAKDSNLNPWLRRQQLRLLALKDSRLDAMAGMTRDNLRIETGSHEASAHGLHQADAGSDAYDRDFALNILSQEQDALLKIDDALKRIELGTYGICEMSGKPIPKARLEAIPFARYTVECQQEVERKNRFSNVRQPITRLFEPVDEETDEETDEESSQENKE